MDDGEGDSMKRLPVPQRAAILAFLDGTGKGTDPWEAVPAINKTLEILGYKERLDFDRETQKSFFISKEANE